MRRNSENYYKELAQTGGALHTTNPVHIIKADGKGMVVHRMGPRGEIQGSIKIVFFHKGHLRIYVIRCWSKVLEENACRQQVINKKASCVFSDIIYSKFIF